MFLGVQIVFRNTLPIWNTLPKKALKQKNEPDKNCTVLFFLVIFNMRTLLDAFWGSSRYRKSKYCLFIDCKIYSNVNHPRPPIGCKITYKPPSTKSCPTNRSCTEFLVILDKKYQLHLNTVEPSYNRLPWYFNLESAIERIPFWKGLSFKEMTKLVCIIRSQKWWTLYHTDAH